MLASRGLSLYPFITVVNVCRFSILSSVFLCSLLVFLSPSLKPCIQNSPWEGFGDLVPSSVLRSFVVHGTRRFLLILGLVGMGLLGVKENGRILFLFLLTFEPQKDKENVANMRSKKGRINMEHFGDFV